MTRIIDLDEEASPAAGDVVLIAKETTGVWYKVLWSTLGGGPAAASQVEAEAGTETALRSWSPLRVAQAIAAKITAFHTATATLTNKTLHGSNNTLTVDGTEAIGFKRIPVLTTSGRTLAATDIGKLVSATGTMTIPNTGFAAGDILTVYNNTASDLTLTCSITTAYPAGDNTDKASMTLATRGFATVVFTGTTSCVVSGNVS